MALTLRGSDRDRVHELALALKEQLEARFTRSSLLGPAAPPIERIENQFRRRLLVKLPARLDAQVLQDKQKLLEVVKSASRAMSRAGVKCVIDVDPLEV
jgi:primosomal protein N'